MTLRAGHRARERASREAWQRRNVVMHVLLEEGVIGLDGRYARPSREPYSGIVREEWRLNVNEIEVQRLQSRERAPERTPSQSTILRVPGNAPGGHANHSLLAQVRLALVFGSNQQRLDSTAREV